MKTIIGLILILAIVTIVWNLLRKKSAQPAVQTTMPQVTTPVKAHTTNHQTTTTTATVARTENPLKTMDRALVEKLSADYNKPVRNTAETAISAKMVEESIEQVPLRFDNPLKAMDRQLTEKLNRDYNPSLSNA